MRKCNARHNLLALSLLLALVGAGLLLLPACRREAIPEPKVLKWALGTAWPEAEDFYPDLAEGASVTFASDNPFPNNEKTMMTKSYETTLVYRTAGGRSAKKTATVDVTVDKDYPNCLTFVKDKETGKESMIIAVKVAMVEVEYEVLVNGKSVTSGKHSFPKGVTSIDEDTARKIIAEVAKNNDKVPANYEFDSTVADNLKVVNGKITVALKVAAA